MKRLFWVFLCLIPAFWASAQKNAKDLRRQADEYFQLNRFAEALDTYRQVQEAGASDDEMLLRLGICSYQLNRLADAEGFLSFVTNNSRQPLPDAFFFLGRVKHAQHDFDAAILNYKEYLRRIRADHANRNMVKDLVLRCANGRKAILSPSTEVLVENLGEQVNSISDDFGPVLSPRIEGRLYFSSVRPGNLGGRRNEAGLVDDKAGAFCSDMFSTSLSNGLWSKAQPLNYLLNSPRHDIILDIASGGTVLYYFKGFTRYAGDMLVDTFKAIEERSLFSAPFSGPLQPEAGDQTPFFFRDSMVLFASRREGGFGGLDLYYSVRRNGAWLPAQNMGAPINSGYDETYPFLAADGRTLYYSSNRSDMSIGGLDIFRSKFDDASLQWQAPQSMGIPVNSAGDDAGFRLSANGLSGYFASERQEGFGGSDLYTAYFREARSEQVYLSFPAAFYQVVPPRQDSALADAVVPGSDGPVVTYDWKPLYFDNDDDVLNFKNTEILKEVITALRKYPDLQLVLSGHSDNTEARKFDLHFSIRRAEKVAAYLQSAGVPSKQILLRGCGAQYPVARNELDGEPLKLGMQFNRRIDLGLIPNSKIPVKLQVTPPRLNESMLSPEWNFFQKANEGLSYRVEIARQKQMYSGDLLAAYPNTLVERNHNDDLYVYTVGLYKTNASAEQLKQELAFKGLESAQIVPYIDGVRINDDQARTLTNKYPDLRFYLAKKN